MLNALDNGVLREAIEVTNAYLSHVAIFLFLSTVTASILFLRERFEWKRARFESRLNISLNFVLNGVLRIRTIHEDDVKNVVLSSYARRLMKKAARNTTLEDPFLHFANKQDAWMVSNEILNTVSSRFGPQIISAVLRGMPSGEAKFLMAITWERDAEIRIQKLRVMLIQEDELRNLCGHPDGIRTERPTHQPRIATLIKMGERWMRGEWPEHQSMALPR